jgi:hypothetical protein
VDKALAAQVGDPDRPSPCERMTALRNDDRRHPEKEMGVAPKGFDPLFHVACFDLLIRDPFSNGHGLRDAEDHPDVWVSRLKNGHHPGQQDEAEGGERPNAKLAPAELNKPGGHLRETLEPGKASSDLVVERGAFGGQQQSPLDAIEELEMNRRLQIANEPADGRLRGVQQDCSVDGRPRMDNSSERFDLMVGDLHVYRK